MNRIHLLPEHVANQIAAGEVIERPASVLKELLENSLDAGATQIDVQIGAGGRSLVAVTDNGCGMSKDDALLCLERHATSKLRNSDDLDRIASYGFRGEAIPSIASVSKFRLRSREHDALAGTEIIIDGGKLRDVHEVGLAPGTQIEVRSLFFNLPARRKFLRTEATESAHIRHTMLLAGLARPEVGFTLTMDEQPAQRWMPGEDLRQRLVSIFGAEWVGLTVPIEAASGELRLRGFIGQPGVSRAARNEELFFINQRPVENRTLHFGLLEGYHNSLMKGRYPVAILFLEMDPSGVDVNIHPAKREVRFHDDFTIRHFVVKSLHLRPPTQNPSMLIVRRSNWKKRLSRSPSSPRWLCRKKRCRRKRRHAPSRSSPIALASTSSVAWRNFTSSRKVPRASS
jgi:DNA mismatch repair protein MutL